ncbi:MAG: tRNA pseudouridine(55) synthase TruB [Bacteroidetes bacterium]|nr:tRNA pseudouridine(55) synthase TruB [Bacteroidota bacterium]
MSPHFTLEQLFNGSTLNINKPLRWTSFDAVNCIKLTANKLKLRNAEGQIRKLKIGHAGTLDPLATGVLVLCTGSCTKQIESIQAQLKEYTGTFFIGATTPCYDLEKEPDTFFQTDLISAELIHAVSKNFVGKIMQAPPVFSAVKVDGKRAYHLARAGQEVAIAEKEVTIYAFEITNITMPVVSFRVVCSKGTYIRSLANDFGKALQSGAYLSSLCRTKVGDYHLELSVTIEEVIARMHQLHQEQSQ